MPTGWVRTRVDKEGNPIFGSPPPTATWQPDLTKPANARRATAVLRDVACHLVGQHPDVHVDPLTVVWNIGRRRTSWSVDCALMALRDHQTHHHPGWTSWPPLVPAHDLALIAAATAGELNPLTTDRKARP